MTSQDSRRDPYEEIERALAWAKSRKPRVMGRVIQLSEESRVKMAIASLKRRGVDLMQGFKDAWEFAMTLNGTPEFIKFA